MASSYIDDPTDVEMVSLILDYLRPQPNLSNLGHGFEVPANFDLQRLEPLNSTANLPPFLAERSGDFVVNYRDPAGAMQDALIDDPEFHFDISYLDDSDINAGQYPSNGTFQGYGTATFSPSLSFPNDLTNYASPFASNFTNDNAEDILIEEGLDLMDGDRPSGLRGGEVVREQLHTQPTSLAYTQSIVWPYAPNPPSAGDTFDNAAVYTSNLITETVDKDMSDDDFDPRSPLPPTLPISFAGDFGFRHPSQAEVHMTQPAMNGFQIGQDAYETEGRVEGDTEDTETPSTDPSYGFDLMLSFKPDEDEAADIDTDQDLEFNFNFDFGFGVGGGWIVDNVGTAMSMFNPGPVVQGLAFDQSLGVAQGPAFGRAQAFSQGPGVAHDPVLGQAPGTAQFSKFKELPPELRIKIQEMALVDSYPLRIVRRACKACPSCKAHNDCKNPIARLHCTTSQPKLLRANRECYSQLPFFYGANKIISPDTDSLKMLREQHAEVVRYIQRIELLHYVAAQARLIELKSFPRLTHLNIRAEDDYSHHFRPSIPGPTTALRLSQIEQEAKKVLNSPVPRSRHPRFVASKREVRYLMVTKSVKVTFTAEYRAGRYSDRKWYETVFEIKLVSGGNGYQLELEEDHEI